VRVLFITTIAVIGDTLNKNLYEWGILLLYMYHSYPNHRNLNKKTMSTFVLSSLLPEWT